MSGINLIIQERYKQRRGYTKEHDDQHTGQELLIVATGLLLNALDMPEATEFCEERGRSEPWMKYIWDHPRENKKDPLAVAGALIAAEIDRLLRLDKKEASPCPKP